LDTALRESLRAQRSAILGLRQDGVISDETFNGLALEIDTALNAEQDELHTHILAGYSSPDAKPPLPGE
jgi:hypothetical protein